MAEADGEAIVAIPTTVQFFKKHQPICDMPILPLFDALSTAALGSLEVLPPELLVHILSFITPSMISPLFRVNKRMHLIATGDALWRQLFAKVADVSRVGNLLHHTKVGSIELEECEGDAGQEDAESCPLEADDDYPSWLQIFKALPNWRWSPNHKAREVQLVNNRLGAIRTDASGRNPAVMASTPMSKTRNHFRVMVTKIGAWVGIGVADEFLVLSGSNTLGTQQRGVNCSYFWQNNGIKKLQMYGEAPVPDVAPLAVGSVVDVYVDFETNLVHFFLDNQLQGVMGSRSKMSCSSLYPCVNLSHGSEVVFCNHDLPDLRTDFEFQWSARKSAAISVSPDKSFAFRSTGEGLNPAVLGNFPLTRERPNFRVKVMELGRWVGIGVCDGFFQIENGKTLGTQPKCLNSAYFYQISGIYKLQMDGMCKDDVKPIAVGDIIDVKVDFDTKRVMYFNNGEYQGYCTPANAVLANPASMDLIPGTLYPCVDMAVNTRLQLINTRHRNNGVHNSVVGDGVFNERRAPAVADDAEDGCDDADGGEGSGARVNRQDPPPPCMMEDNHGHSRFECMPIDPVLPVVPKPSPLIDSRSGVVTPSRGPVGGRTRAGTKRARSRSGDVVQLQEVVPDPLAEVFTMFESLSHFSGSKRMREEEVTLDVNSKWNRVLSQHPTNWAWSVAEEDGRVSNLEYSPTRTAVSRSASGEHPNPVSLASTPLTRANPFFVVEVPRVGDWVAVGIADKSVQSACSHVLGSQIGCLNASYFCQKRIRKLRISYPARGKPLSTSQNSVVEGVIAVAPGDHVGVRVDFNLNRVYFYNNDLVQGFVTCDEGVLREGEVFPAVGLAVGTSLTFVNQAQQQSVVSLPLSTSSSSATWCHVPTKRHRQY
jgi:hypothetical protein